MIAVALTIAGSDSSGGAGIQADLKTFSAFGVFGASVLTALTAQNTRGVRAIAELEPAFVAAQFDAVCDDLPIAAAKTGMLSNRSIIEAAADRLRSHGIANIVVDPVMVAASGDVLLRPDAVESMKTLMIPLAAVATPNIRETEILLGRKINDLASMRDAARGVVELGARAALITGGAPDGNAIDVFFDGHSMREFAAARVQGRRAHGAGCTLSAAIAAGLALGHSMEDSIEAAKRYVWRALKDAPALGHGARLLNHLVSAKE